MNNAANVTAAKPKTGGALYVAEYSDTVLAALKTAGVLVPIEGEDGTYTYAVNPAAALPNSFKCLGYISDAGFTMSQSRESSSVKAWGGDTVLNTQTGYSESAKYSLIEALNPDVLKQVYGEDNVNAGDSVITINTSSDELPVKTYVVDMVMKGNRAKRVIVPCGQVTAVSDTTYDDSNAVGFETTLAITPDSYGNYHYEGITA